MATGSYLTNNYLKRKWVECTNQKTKTGWMDTKIRPLYMLSTRDPRQNKGHIQTESEGLEKDIPCKWNQKKAEVAIFISDKIDFKTKAVKRDKEGHYIMIKGWIEEGSRRRYINYKYICTQHRSTAICKAYANKYERGK